jgi:hypothetical protein
VGGRLAGSQLGAPASGAAIACLLQAAVMWSRWRTAQGQQASMLWGHGIGTAERLRGPPPSTKRAATDLTGDKPVPAAVDEASTSVDGVELLRRTGPSDVEGVLAWPPLPACRHSPWPLSGGAVRDHRSHSQPALTFSG